MLSIAQNHRIAEVGRKLWRWPGSNLCSSTATYSRQPKNMLWAFWVSPRTETPQPLWAPCSWAWSHSQCKSVSLCSDRISCVSVCTFSILFCYWAPGKRACLHPLHTLPSDNCTHCRFPTPTLAFSGLNSSICLRSFSIQLNIIGAWLDWHPFFKGSKKGGYRDVWPPLQHHNMLSYRDHTNFIS